MSSEHKAAPEQSRPQTKLVIVTGSGRSGTSTAAGTLKKLGLYVPQPEVRANSSNPRGFFEPRWAVDFHKRVLTASGVRTLDARPEAWDLLAGVTSRPGLKTELKDWFAAQLQGPQIVVKDPRAFWLRDLWVEVASELGVHTEFLTMLRHPAEVVGSRRMHYQKSADDERLHARETANVAGWVNVALTSERVSRPNQRAFAQYTDLIADWRSTMQDVGRRLDLDFNADLTTQEHHEVDDFIDGNLRRAEANWDGLDLPDRLRDIAEAVWQGLVALALRPDDSSAMATLDAAHDEYLALHTHSVALVQDYTNSAIGVARRQARRRMARELEQLVAKPATPRPKASIPRRLVRKARRLRARRAPKG